MQGPYVIVFLNSAGGSKSIPPGWLASCYRQLSYPFRKNVKHVILVRPSAGLKFMLAIMRPLLSPKAYVKVKKVTSRTPLSPPPPQPFPQLAPGWPQMGRKFMLAIVRQLISPKVYVKAKKVPLDSLHHSHCSFACEIRLRLAAI